MSCCYFLSFQVNTCFVWRFESLHTIPLCRLKLPKAYTDLTTYVTWTAIRFKKVVDFTISFKLPSYAPIYCHKSHWQMLVFVENDILSKLCLFLCVVSNYQKHLRELLILPLVSSYRAKRLFTATNHIGRYECLFIETDILFYLFIKRSI